MASSAVFAAVKIAAWVFGVLEVGNRRCVLLDQFGITANIALWRLRAAPGRAATIPSAAWICGFDDYACRELNRISPFLTMGAVGENEPATISLSMRDLIATLAIGVTVPSASSANRCLLFHRQLRSGSELRAVRLTASIARSHHVPQKCACQNTPRRRLTTAIRTTPRIFLFIQTVRVPRSTELRRLNPEAFSSHFSRVFSSLINRISQNSSLSCRKPRQTASAYHKPVQ